MVNGNQRLINYDTQTVSLLSFVAVVVSVVVSHGMQLAEHRKVRMKTVDKCNNN